MLSVGRAQRWPNGLPFSCRKRTVTAYQKANDLAREAVGCNGGLGGWRVTLVCCPHERTTPARNHACITSVRWNHSTHTITLGMTGKEHHEPSNHACTTSTGTTSLAPRAFPNRDRLITIEKGMATTLPSRPTDCRSAAASA